MHTGPQSTLHLSPHQLMGSSQLCHGDRARSTLPMMQVGSRRTQNSCPLARKSVCYYTFRYPKPFPHIFASLQCTSPGRGPDQDPSTSLLSFTLAPHLVPHLSQNPCFPHQGSQIPRMWTSTFSASARFPIPALIPLSPWPRPPLWVWLWPENWPYPSLHPPTPSF